MFGISTWVSKTLLLRASYPTLQHPIWNQWMSSIPKCRVHFTVWGCLKNSYPHPGPGPKDCFCLITLTCFGSYLCRCVIKHLQFIQNAAVSGWCSDFPNSHVTRLLCTFFCWFPVPTSSNPRIHNRENLLGLNHFVAIWYFSCATLTYGKTEKCQCDPSGCTDVTCKI